MNVRTIFHGLPGDSSDLERVRLDAEGPSISGTQISRTVRYWSESNDYSSGSSHAVFVQRHTVP